MFKCPVCETEFESELAYRMNNGCDTCGWEEDSVQENDPKYTGGANRESLNEAKAAWEKKQAEAEDANHA
jgi:predicted  nucleic acid-binding Zn-ribbon protein